MICYTFTEPLFLIFSKDLPSLLYYSHIPATAIALIVGFFVYFNGRKFLLNRLLLLISVCFSLWTLCNLISWTNIHSSFILFTWSFFGILSSFISIFCIYFVYVFLTKEDVSLRIKTIFAALLAPVLLLAATSVSLAGFNLTACDAFEYEGLAFQIYYTSLGVLAILWIFALLVGHYRRSSSSVRKQIILMGIGIESFLFSFFTMGFLGSYLTSLGLLPDSQIEMYGLFGMIVFMIYLAIIIVRFKTFNVGLLASQALVMALIVLIGAQLTFVRSLTNMILTAIALVLTGLIGIILIRSVRREILLRKHVETLAKDLEKSNQQQIILIHFITHQIKGFVAKSRNIFAGLREGDYGVLPDTMVPLVEEGFRSDTKGAETIQEILNAANIKSGKVTYKKESFDLKALIEEVLSDLRPLAEKKGLELTSALADVTLTGDKVQLVNAFKNLIDNSIKYTPSGSVAISLAQTDGKVHFEIKDTGVGITEEDMKGLFTEGGRGKNSQRVNVESTGFGLFIVKNIVEAHGGKVWAESEGGGKGSRFIVELPA